MKKIICLLILALLVLINNGCKTTYNLSGDGIILNSFVTNNVGGLNGNRSAPAKPKSKAESEPKSEVEIVRSMNEIFKQAIGTLEAWLKTSNEPKEDSSKVINKLNEIQKNLNNINEAIKKLNESKPPPSDPDISVIFIQKTEKFIGENPIKTVLLLGATIPILLARVVELGRITIELSKIYVKFLSEVLSLFREILSSIKKLFIFLFEKLSPLAKKLISSIKKLFKRKNKQD